VASLIHTPRPLFETASDLADLALSAASMSDVNMGVRGGGTHFIIFRPDSQILASETGFESRSASSNPLGAASQSRLRGRFPFPEEIGQASAT
jgi:hypothetical protein